MFVLTDVGFWLSAVGLNVSAGTCDGMIFVFAGGCNVYFPIISH